MFMVLSSWHSHCGIEVYKHRILLQYWSVRNDIATIVHSDFFVLFIVYKFSYLLTYWSIWQICDEPLHSIRAHDQGFLLATGSHSGATTLLELSSALSSLQRNEKSIITAVTEHSVHDKLK